MDPDENTAGETDLTKLREELASERRSRAWLESRLEELDQRLRRSQAAERAMQNAGAQEQVALLGLQASLTAEAVKESDREELDLWLQVAAMHAEATEVALPASAPRAELIPVLREPAADARYEEKLAGARAAMEAAEARAAHQATQMRRLSDELAASRAEQMRAMNRIRDLEKKLLRIETQAELLESVVSERVVDKGAPEFDLPAETMAPLDPVKPGLVYTETAEGTQLAPAEPEPEDDAPGLSLEEFEPKAFPRTSQSAVATDDVDLESALTDFFGGPTPEADLAPDTSLDVFAAPPEEERAAPASVDALADALEIWGGGPAETFETPAASAPAPKARVERVDVDSDPFSGLAGALASLSSAPIETPATANAANTPAAAPEDDDPFGGLTMAMQELSDEADSALEAKAEAADAPTASPADDEDPFGGLASAMEELGGEDAAVEELFETDVEPAEAGAETVTEEAPIEAETIVVEAVSADEATHTPDATPTRGGNLYDALERAVGDGKSTRRGRTNAASTQSPKTERTAAMADSLSTWSGESGEHEGEQAKPPKGRAAMVDALLRFMGPQ